MIIQNRVSEFKNRVYETANSILLPESGIEVPKASNILMVKTDAHGNKELMAAANLITTAGDEYYGENAANETATNTFNSLYLSTATFSPAISKSSDAGDLANVISGSEKAVAASYPRTSDPDSDNTGSGPAVVSWQFNYAAADFNATGIVTGTITVAGATFGSGSQVLLSAFSFTSFDKTASDTLKVIVNHTLLGA